MDEFAKGMYTTGKFDDSERDLVTGLLTRQAGMNQIRTYMESYKTTTCALIIFEGDNFRRISDSWGRDQRERVLAICAGEIERRFGGKGIIFRMDGDEFAVFYRDTDEIQVRILLDVFISSVRRANSISGFNFPITFSIGIAMYPEMGKNPRDLFIQADRALIQAKSQGKARYRFADKNMKPTNTDQFMFTVDEFSRGMPGGFFVYEAYGDEKLLYVSESVAKMFHCLSVEDLRRYTGNSFRGIVHPDDLMTAENEIMVQQYQMPDNKECYHYVRYRILCRDGVVKTVDNFGHLVEDPHFGAIYYVCLLDLDNNLFKASLRPEKINFLQ